jgi:hypothetical protein
MNFIACVLAARVALDHAHGAGRNQALVPDELDRTAGILFDQSGAGRPDQRHRGFAVQEHRLAFGAAAPVGNDIVLEGGDLLVGAFEVERVELCRLDAIGEKRCFPHAGAPFVERALAGEFFDVEEIGHAGRHLSPNFEAS